MAFVRPWEDKEDSFNNSGTQPELSRKIVTQFPYINIQTQYIPDYFWVHHQTFMHQSNEHYNTNHSIDVKPCDLTPSSSDYSSEDTTSPCRRYSPYQNRNRHNRLLNTDSINTMTSWYENNTNNPYLTQQEATNLSTKCHLTVEQVKKWMANKRMRNRNTKQHKRTKRKIKKV